MKAKIKDATAFDVAKFERNATKGPKKKRGQRVISENVQLKWPWYDDLHITEKH